MGVTALAKNADVIARIRTLHAGGKEDVRELDEHQAHRFLEKRGETATVKELRDGTWCTWLRATCALSIDLVSL